ncbi:hypothetical protein ENSA5_36190 [Enhygromyxa salina]|uniref:Hydrogenase maturation protease n=1 Tax=Enhygromyxa salina TaxID=215803 RepID=A0A2S9XUM3_9BACT|nr:hydrogenase maturation protease [Enhygromyxa salina]PRP96543.1 hypothetical protein ENSA5_36190 [Enhygromyxa salina]
MKARIIALGNEAAGDDGAAILAARQLEGEFTVTIAGRPGARLLELLDPLEPLEPPADSGPTILVDVTRSGRSPGTIVSLPLASIAEAAIASAQMSSHGFGPSETLRLGAALGRPLPPGRFVGVEGWRFEIGQPLSPPLAAALDDLVAAIRSAAADSNSGSSACTKAASSES